VVALGWNYWAQATVPAGLTSVTGIAAGDYCSLALKIDGTIEVAPSSYPFGDIPVGSSSTTVVTISNVGHAPLTVTSYDLYKETTPFDFTVTSGPAVPFTLDPVAAGGTISSGDVAVTFSPTVTGSTSGIFQVQSDDPVHPVVFVSFSGNGVAAPPAQRLGTLLAFFDASVSTGALAGSGSGNSAQGRLDALRNMLRSAGDLIGAGDYADACQVLLDAYQRVDGLPRPPDFATGPAAEQLRSDLRALMASLSCS
jgi:hypothetical protein